jgi:hypothetical protein
MFKLAFILSYNALSYKKLNIKNILQIKNIYSLVNIKNDKSIIIYEKPKSQLILVKPIQKANQLLIPINSKKYNLRLLFLSDNHYVFIVT